MFVGILIEKIDKGQKIIFFCIRGTSNFSQKNRKLSGRNGTQTEWMASCWLSTAVV
jgi:hypothetical protein